MHPADFKGVAHCDCGAAEKADGRCFAAAGLCSCGSRALNFNATPPASASQGQQKRERRRLARAWFVSARAFAAHMMSSGEQADKAGKIKKRRRIRWRVLEVTPKTPGPLASADLHVCVCVDEPESAHEAIGLSVWLLCVCVLVA